jgi:mRNA interferase RelE/StbE
MYKVSFIPSALKKLKKFDKYTQRMLLGWIRKNLEDCIDPRIHGKALKSNRSGQWRYRLGDYRIIALIKDKQLVILVIAVGH